MKIRIGFVSNSSSSSFIIGILSESKQCPTCGRGGTDIEDLFEHSKDYDTSLSNLEGFIDQLKLDVFNYKKRIEELKLFPNRKSKYYKSLQEEINSNQELLEDAQDRLETILSYQKQCEKVCYCKISYHDEYVNKELRSKVKSGEIIMKDIYEN